MEMTKSPYRAGAEKGQLFGLYLSAIILSSILSSHIPFLSILTLVLIIGVPVVIYRQLRQRSIAREGNANISELWMQGIITFACGALICALIILLYLMWIEPNYIMTTLTNSMNVYQSLGTEMGNNLAETIKLMIEQHMVPSASDIALSMFWFITATGSLLSLVISILVKFITPTKKTSTN